MTLNQRSQPTLSRREREVAALVAEGLTNKEIGARLFIYNPGDYGHFTLSFGQGLFHAVAPDGSLLTGTYAVDGNMIRFFRTDSDGPGKVWTFAWSVVGDRLTFVKAGRGEHPTPLIVKPWSRVTS